MKNLKGLKLTKDGGRCECGGRIIQSTYADWCDSCDWSYSY